MAHNIRQQISSIRSWLNDHAMTLVVFLSITHVALAYILPRDSG
jgi:hypothetical protein